MKCPKCGKTTVFDHPTCPRCGHEMMKPDGLASSEAASQHEENTGVPLSRPDTQSDITQRKNHSKGGLIATGVMTALCVAALLQMTFDVAVFLGYLVANIALLGRSFRPPLRWWQAILVWVGGLLVGTSFSPFLGPPTFEEQVVGSAAALPGKLLAFVGFFLVGAVLILLGSLRRKPR